MIDRIVVINDLARPMGGASLLAVQSARQFAERGYPVTMISGDDGPAEPLAGVDHVSAGHERLLGADLAVAAVRGLYNGAARRLVAQWIERKDTPGTVYHVHGWSQILSPALFGALAPVRSRTVMTAHDFFLTCPNGAFYDYVAAEPCARKPMSMACIAARCDRRHHVHKVWRTARQAMQTRLFAGGDVPVQLLIHAGMRSYFERSGLGDDDMVVLPNPVTAYCPSRVRAEANRDVLFVGRMEATKGVDLAAEACRRAGARLVAVGDGALLETLRAQYPEMAFVGRLSQAEIAPLAERARLLVMPSRHMEPFGLTVVEALWSGLPVLTAHHALIAEDIQRTGAGVPVDCLDAEGFAAEIAALLRDDARVRRMSLAAFEGTRHLALEPGTWIDALLAVYATLLAGGRAKRARAEVSAIFSPSPVTLTGAQA